MNLYEITKQYRDIFDSLYDDEGNVNEDMLARLNSTDLLFEEKAISTASYIKNLESTIKSIKEAKDIMSKRQKALEKRIDDLHGYLLANMESIGASIISCPYFEIKLKKNPVSVDDETINMDLLPEEYINVKIERKPDKTKIKNDILAGVVVEGASLKQGLRVEIK